MSVRGWLAWAWIALSVSVCALGCGNDESHTIASAWTGKASGFSKGVDATVSIRFVSFINGVLRGSYEGPGKRAGFKARYETSHLRLIEYDESNPGTFLAEVSLSGSTLKGTDFAGHPLELTADTAALGYHVVKEEITDAPQPAFDPPKPRERRQSVDQILAGLGGGTAMVPLLLAFLVVVPIVGGLFGIFRKAGRSGWAVLVPIYSEVVLLQIIRRPLWWIGVSFAAPLFSAILPAPFDLYASSVATLAVYVLLCEGLARAFGRSPLFAAGLFVFPPLFLMILGYGSSYYRYREEEPPKKKRKRKKKAPEEAGP